MTSPPRPPSPPSGPPLGTNFSRRKLTEPRPPLPAWAKTLIRSTNISLLFLNNSAAYSVELVMRLSTLTLIAFLASAGICCAQSSPTPAATSGETGIEGTITISPTHPGPVRPGMANSAPLTNVAFVVRNETATVAEFMTDDHGHFKITLAPGHYTIARKDLQKIGR